MSRIAALLSKQVLLGCSDFKVFKNGKTNVFKIDNKRTNFPYPGRIT